MQLATTKGNSLSRAISWPRKPGPAERKWSHPFWSLVRLLSLLSFGHSIYSFLLYSYLNSFKFLKDRLLFIQVISPHWILNVSMKFTHFQEENCSVASEYIRICKNVLRICLKHSPRSPSTYFLPINPFLLPAFLIYSANTDRYLLCALYPLCAICYRIKIS